MSTTKTIHNVVATEVATTVPTFPRTNLVLVDSFESPSKLDRESTYQLATGDENYPLTVRVGIYLKPDANNGIGAKNISVAIHTVADEVDDTTEEVLWKLPVKATLAISLPGVSGLVDTADFIDLVSNLYTMFFSGVDGNTDPNTNIADKMKFNIPHIHA
jgi:hypothetical protein